MFVLKDSSEGFMIVRIALIICMFLIMPIRPVYALGVGAATAQTYIGQPLMLIIPLFNVSNPQTLTVELSSLSTDIGGAPELSAQIDRSNSQLSIVVKSDRAINEPYFGFNLQVADGQQTLNKEFTVLLNLSPQRLPSSSATSDSSQSYDLASPKVQGIGNNPSTSGSGDVLGPYDWAVEGNIPNRFGAVIDGQSLWRVARRINKAMGVSIDQMMWALYQQNQEAFSTSSVDSLRAGSYLTIPSYDVVSQVSDRQAKAELQRLSNNPESNAQISSPTSDIVAATPSADVLPVDVDALSQGNVAESQGPSDDDAGAGSDPDSFQLTGLSDANSLLNGGDSSDAKAQEIISSLAVTVGNLTQELIRKDKRIEFLEEKVAALEKVASLELDIMPLESASSESIAEAEVARVDMVSEDSPAIDIESSLAAKPLSAEADSEVENEPETQSAEADSLGVEVENEPEPEVIKPEPQVKKGFELGWLVWLLPLLLVLVAVFAFRNKLISLAQQLNLIGSDEEIDFERNEVKLSPAPMSMDKPKKDYSVMLATQKNDEEHEGVDVVEDVSFLSFNDIDNDASLDADAVDADAINEADEQSLDFEQRFLRLLDEKDYDFARELLDFARHNEINDERYHCERLRLCYEMEDEDGFYDYYYEIESKIPAFDQEMQNRISKLVVELSKGS